MSRPIMLGAGTQPEPVKMATVYRAMHAVGANIQVLHTGHHDSRAWASCDFFETATRNVMALERDGSTLAHGHAVLRTKPQDKPELFMPRAVLLHGERSSAGMLALAAFCKQIPVSHVAAGLHSDDNDNPFPEAMNCQLTSEGLLTLWTTDAVRSVNRPWLIRSR